MFTLEHYPGMTEKALARRRKGAFRWPLGAVTVIHRVGEFIRAMIVFVGVTSAHRSSAFDAGQFIMDYLKTRAPFWKREATGDRWSKRATATSSRRNVGSRMRYALGYHFHTGVHHGQISTI